MINIHMPIINYNCHWYSFPKNKQVWFRLFVTEKKTITIFQPTITYNNYIYVSPPPRPLNPQRHALATGAWPLLRSLRRSTARWPPSSPAPRRRPRRSSGLRRRRGACGALAVTGAVEPVEAPKGGGKFMDVPQKCWNYDEKDGGRCSHVQHH